MKLQGLEVRKVEDLKYLWSFIHSNTDCGKEVKCVQACWNQWRNVSGVLCDRRVSARMKGRCTRWWGWWFRDSGTEEIKGGRAGSGTAGDVGIYFCGNKDGSRTR